MKANNKWLHTTETVLEAVIGGLIAIVASQVTI